MQHLSDDVKLTVVQAGLADGQSDPDSDRVDMAGYDGVMFVCQVGTITGSGTVTMAAKQAATDAVGDALSGASVVATAAADSDKLLVIDIFRPTDRYVGVTLTRATANSVIGGVVAIQYRAKAKPTTHDSDSMAADAVTLVSPAES